MYVCPKRARGFAPACPLKDCTAGGKSKCEEVGVRGREGFGFWVEGFGQSSCFFEAGVGFSACGVGGLGVAREVG